MRWHEIRERKDHEAESKSHQQRPGHDPQNDSLLFEVDAGQARVSVERKPASFAGYASIWREGKGMRWEEVSAHVR